MRARWSSAASPLASLPIDRERGQRAGTKQQNKEYE
jgi:hypothetical protein